MRKEPFVTYVNNLYVYPETLSLKVPFSAPEDLRWSFHWTWNAIQDCC
jgi:hypothetical protein